MSAAKGSPGETVRGLGEPISLCDCLSPGALVRTIEDSERVEAYIPPAGHDNHAANLCALPNGDLLCVWFAGLVEGFANVSIACSRLSSGAASWTRPVLVSDDATRSEQNPILWCEPDGPLWLLYTAQLTRGVLLEEWERLLAAGEASGGYHMQWTAEVRRRLSWDHGLTWGAVETFAAKPGSFCRQPPIVTGSGAWLLPLYYSRQDTRGSHSADSTVIWRSTDRGASWAEIEMPASRGRVHASLVDQGDGHIAAFLRSRAADRIYRSDSSDDGLSWSTPARTGLPNNNSSIQALRLSSGELAIAYNDCSGGDDPTATVWRVRRMPLTVALSEDGGQTWPYRRHIDMGDGFCGPANSELNRRLAYPTLIEMPAGVMHLAYSFRSRECIKYLRIPVSWVRDRQGWVYRDQH